MSSQAKIQIQEIMKSNSSKGLQKQLKKAFKYLQNNPRHPSLKSHLFQEVSREKVWTSYVQNNTPQAHRILWIYGEKKKTIYILQVRPHY